MTRIDPEHPVVRETDATYRGRPIIIELHPRYITFGVKDLRSMRASLGIEGAHDVALLRQAQNRLEIQNGGGREEAKSEAMRNTAS